MNEFTEFQKNEQAEICRISQRVEAVSRRQGNFVIESGESLLEALKRQEASTGDGEREEILNLQPLSSYRARVVFEERYERLLAQAQELETLRAWLKQQPDIETPVPGATYPNLWRRYKAESSSHLAN